MALGRQYPEDFEKLWAVWPKWPTGRSKKEPSFRAFVKAKKDLGFTQHDLEQIHADIVRRIRDCETWQKGNKFGPEMFATYFNQHRWNEPYQKVRGAAADRPTGVVMSDEENKRAWAIEQFRKGLPVPPSYERYLH